MSGHTPGPLEVFPSEWDNTLYVMPEGQWEGRGGPDTVAVIASHFTHGEANARLIAAAPDLLEALKILMDEMGALTNKTELFNRLNDTDAEKVYAAYAKATGSAT